MLALLRKFLYTHHFEGIRLSLKGLAQARGLEFMSFLKQIL